MNGVAQVPRAYEEIFFLIYSVSSVQQNDFVIHTIYIFFSRYFSIIGYHMILDIVP